MFLHYLSYAAFLAAFAFITLSLASGLLYVSELIEEHSRLAKIIGQRGTYFILVLHVVLYFTESLPVGHTLFSMACHIIYLQNFSSNWPMISLTSISFLASCVAVISDHFVWFFYFSKKTQEARHRTYRNNAPDALGFADMATFFGTCVWLAPLFLFLSLSANDNALPMSATATSHEASGSQPIPRQRGSLFRSIFAIFDVDIPRLRRKTPSDGIIAPNTPTTPRTPSSPAFGSPALSRSYERLSSPPRSPRVSGEFRLQSIPKSSTGTIRRAARPGTPTLS